MLVLALGSLAFSRRTTFFVIGAAVLATLVLLDQTRLQPWVYQYSLIMAVLALASPHPVGDGSAKVVPLGLVQIIVGGLYVWSGVQKLNYTFVHETLPLVLAPLSGRFPLLASPPAFIGIAAAITELLIGLGLLWRKTRGVAVVAAISMHLVILSLLIARDYNRVVWAWNAALIGLVATAFWRSGFSSLSALKVKDTRGKVAGALVATAVLLPILSFFGWWDMYLSGALYSGNVNVAVVRIDPSLLDDLSDSARSVVFHTRTTGETILPLFEWSVADVGAPVYPEDRTFRSVFREICRASKGNGSLELIIKERPALLDGTYQVTRSDCLQLRSR